MQVLSHNWQREVVYQEGASIGADGAAYLPSDDH
jgi:hypothetical protein